MINFENETEVLKRAIHTYGESSQIDMAIEEMAELTIALLKYKRAERSQSEYDFKTIRSNISEEIADVMIMVSQLVLIFETQNEIVDCYDSKIRRLEKRLERES